MFERIMAANILLWIVWLVSQFIVAGERCDPGLWARFTGCPVAGVAAVATVTQPRGSDGTGYAAVHNGRGGDVEEVVTYQPAWATLRVIAGSEHSRAAPSLSDREVQLDPWCEYDGMVNYRTVGDDALADAIGVGEAGLVEGANSKAALRVPLVEPRRGDSVYAFCEAAYAGWFRDLEWECTYVCTHHSVHN